MFEVSIMVVIKIIVFWKVMLCSFIEIYQCFQKTWYFHLQGRRARDIWEDNPGQREGRTMSLLSSISINCEFKVLNTAVLVLIQHLKTFNLFLIKLHINLCNVGTVLTKLMQWKCSIYYLKYLLPCRGVFD